MPTVVYASPEDIGLSLALEIRSALKSSTGPEPWVLGLSTGRTFLPALRALCALEEVDWRRLRLVLPDAYCRELDNGYELFPPVSNLNPVHFIHVNLFEPVRRNWGYRFSSSQVWLPDPNDLHGSEAQLRSSMVDLMLLASGSGDGHVAFNPPGTAMEAMTSIVELPESTKQDNIATYPDFRSVRDVPALGVTLGIRTIIEVSRQAVLVAAGVDKARALAMIGRHTTYSPSWPASVIHECRFSRVLTDVDAVLHSNDFEDSEVDE